MAEAHRQRHTHTPPRRREALQHDCVWAVAGGMSQRGWAKSGPPSKPSPKRAHDQTPKLNPTLCGHIANTRLLVRIAQGCPPMPPHVAKHDRLMMFRSAANGPLPDISSRSPTHQDRCPKVRARHRHSPLRLVCGQPEMCVAFLRPPCACQLQPKPHDCESVTASPASTPSAKGRQGISSNAPQTSTTLAMTKANKEAGRPRGPGGTNTRRWTAGEPHRMLTAIAHGRNGLRKLNMGAERGGDHASNTSRGCTRAGGSCPACLHHMCAARAAGDFHHNKSPGPIPHGVASEQAGNADMCAQPSSSTSCVLKKRGARLSQTPPHLQQSEKMRMPTTRHAAGAGEGVPIHGVGRPTRRARTGQGVATCGPAIRHRSRRHPPSCLSAGRHRRRKTNSQPKEDTIGKGPDIDKRRSGPCQHFPRARLRPSPLAGATPAHLSPHK